MTPDAVLLMLLIHFIDPFKVVPLLAICYHAKSRGIAVALGAAVCVLVQLLTYAFIGKSVIAVPMTITAAIFGAAIAAALQGPFSRWRMRRTAAKS